MRASRWDAEAAPLGEQAQLEHDATGEVDPEQIVERVARVVDAVMAQGGEVTAVATATLWHSLIGLDEHGRPLTPLYSWADSRSAPWAARLRERLDERAVHVRTGARLHSSYWPAKLAWLRDTQPETFARVRTWVSPGEYVQRRLLGGAAASVSMASGTGMLDLRACTWDRELAAELGVEETLPPIDDAPRHGLAGEWAERWPALRDVPWFPAWGDGATSNVGAGCQTKDRAALMIGTSGALRDPRPRRAARAAAVAVVLSRRCRADPARRLAVGRRERGGVAAAADPAARAGGGRERDRRDGARLARADRAAAALRRARAGLERPRGRGDRGPHRAPRRRSTCCGPGSRRSRCASRSSTATSRGTTPSSAPAAGS